MTELSGINWSQYIYDEDNVSSLNTIYGQLSRIAINRAVYLSIVKMSEDRGVQPSDILGNFIQEGHMVDFVVSLRRQLDSNMTAGKKGVKKYIKEAKQVVSLQGLIEDLGLDGEEFKKRLEGVSSLAGLVGNKVFAHNDRKFAEKGPEGLPKYQDLEKALQELHSILIDAGKLIGIDIPDKLIPRLRYDWADAFNEPWKDVSFDCSEFWDC